jgi:hypothetical protein
MFWLVFFSACSEDDRAGPVGEPRAWTIVREPDGDDHYGVWISPTNEVFVVGENGGALRSTDGKTWNQLDTGVASILRGVYGTTSQDVYAVGMDGTMLHFDGGSWTPFAAPSAVSLFALTIVDGDLFVVGDGGLRARLVNGAWETTTEPFSWYLGVWGTAADDVFAVGSNGAGHYDGESWTDMQTPPGGPIFDVWGASSVNVYAVGFDGIILHYNGTRWDPMDSGQEAGHLRAFRGVWGTSKSDILAVGGYNLWGDEAGAHDGVIDRFNGLSWQVQESPTTLNLGDVFGRGGVVYAVGDQGVIIRY